MYIQRCTDIDHIPRRYILDRIENHRLFTSPLYSPTRSIKIRRRSVYIKKKIVCVTFFLKHLVYKNL